MEVSQYTCCGLCATPSKLIHREGAFHVETPCTRCGSYLIAQLPTFQFLQTKTSESIVVVSSDVNRNRVSRPTIGVIEAEDLQRWFDR